MIEFGGQKPASPGDGLPVLGTQRWKIARSARFPVRKAARAGQRPRKCRNCHYALDAGGGRVVIIAADLRLDLLQARPKWEMSVNLDGIVGTADYALWAANFGQSGVSASVPEPATSTLACLGLAMMLISRIAWPRAIRTLATVIVAASWIETGRASPLVWNLAADWSDSANPNGPWAYNGENGQPISVHLDDHDPFTDSFADAQPAWALAPYDPTFFNPGHVPLWMRAASSASGLDIPIGRVATHTPNEAAGDYSSITWRSPIAGEIVVSGGAWLARIRNETTWRLEKNATLLSQAHIAVSDSYNSANPMSFALGTGGPNALRIDVAAGDVIRLSLQRFSGGEYVGVDLTITEIIRLLGDADRDCEVGAVDYAIWAATFGLSGVGLRADFDRNGSVGASDYALWAANFGKTCPPVGASVPEPSGVLLGTMGIAILGICTRRRGSTSG